MAIKLKCRGEGKLGYMFFFKIKIDLKEVAQNLRKLKFSGYF